MTSEDFREMCNPDESSRYRSLVHELADLGHRGSGTAKEREAAGLLFDRLAELGLNPETQPFAGSRAWGARDIALLVPAVAGAAVLPWWPLAGAALGLLALLGLIADHTTLGPKLASAVARAPSQNVFATIPARGEKRATVLLCGHYDTQRTGWIWNPSLQGHLTGASWLPAFARLSFFPVTLGLLGQIALGLGVGMGPLRPLAIPVAALILFVDLVALVFIADWTRSAFVPGAIDNASGAAAVLTLTERMVSDPIPGLEVLVLLTGCEESGLLGATAWASANVERRRELTFLNLDCVGGGPTRYLAIDVPVVGPSLRYPPKELALAADVAETLPLRPTPISLPGPTDGVPFLARGYRGLTILGIGAKDRMPNYHLPSDTAEGVDYGCAMEAIDFAWALMRRIAGR